MRKEVQTVSDYLRKNYRGNKRFMANNNGCQTGLVDKWIEKEYIIIDGVLYSPRRKLVLDD